MLQAALDHSHAGIAIADAPDGVLRYVNQAALEIRGSFRSEIVEGVDIGKYVLMWQIYHFDGTPYRDEEVPLARAVMSGETVSEEFIIRRPDGENRVVWANAAPILDEEGNVISGIVIFLDITERKQIEESLRLKEEMLTRTERIAKVGSWEWDIDPDRVTWSEELFNFFGLDPSEGAPPFGEQAKIYIGEDFEELKRAVELCRTKGTPYDLQLRTVRADGEIRHCIVSGVAERDASGEISRLAGSFQDITERVVQEGEREVLQRQLVQAQRLESIGRLAGGVAHDFNNMLSVILGNAELAMLDIGKDQPIHNNLEEILVAAERSRDVTRQLLAFARKQTIAPESRIIDEVLSGMQKMLKRLIGEDIELTLVLSEKPWTVRLDPTQLEQAVINLCLNARDAISGQGRISLKTANVNFDEKDAALDPGVSPGDFVLLEVSDNGCGMDQETLDSVFEPFFTTKESEQGTGLGMATVYGIVMQSGGFILPASEPGKGSTFKLYFPRCKVRGRRKKQEKKSTLPLACSEKILLVEDEAAVMKMARRMLEKQGYRVLAAEDPSAALDLVSSDPEPLDLLITDVVMPGMNGRELVQKMQEYHPGIKVIYMSGYTADVIAKQGVLEQGVHFLQKPFSSHDLGQLVRDVLNG